MKGIKRLTIVIKLGSSSIIDEQTHEPRLSVITVIVETAVKLRQDGHRVIIVSSGAIAVGLQRMDIAKKPKNLPRIQALAAIGQCRLIGLWDSLFAHMRQPVAQILLTRNDIADRTQYLNAQNTFMELLNMDVIPIVNENDTLAVTEIKFGDNDTLSAITAAMVQADYLFLMTDVDCLYEKNPRLYPDAQPIEVIEDISSLDADVSTPGSTLGTGGMSTKIVAARLATSAGVTTIITRSSSPGNIVKIVKHSLAINQEHCGTPSAPATPSRLIEKSPLSRSVSALNLENLQKPSLHTRFLPDPHPIRDRSFWLLHGLAPHGTIFIDEGAHHALISKAGLLPVGIVDVKGTFSQHEAVRIVVVSRDFYPTLIQLQSSPEKSSSSPSASMELGLEVGRALVNYSAVEIARIKGIQSTEIESVLGYADSEYVALRENVSLMKREKEKEKEKEKGDEEEKNKEKEEKEETGISSRPRTPSPNARVSEF